MGRLANVVSGATAERTPPSRPLSIRKKKASIRNAAGRANPLTVYQQIHHSDIRVDESAENFETLKLDTGFVRGGRRTSAIRLQTAQERRAQEARRQRRLAEAEAAFTAISDTHDVDGQADVACIKAVLEEYELNFPADVFRASDDDDTGATPRSAADVDPSGDSDDDALRGVSFEGFKRVMLSETHATDPPTSEEEDSEIDGCAAPACSRTSTRLAAILQLKGIQRLPSTRRSHGRAKTRASRGGVLQSPDAGMHHTPGSPATVVDAATMRSAGSMTPTTHHLTPTSTPVLQSSNVRIALSLPDATEPLPAAGGGGDGPLDGSVGPPRRRQSRRMSSSVTSPRAAHPQKTPFADPVYGPDQWMTLGRYFLMRELDEFLRFTTAGDIMQAQLGVVDPAECRRMGQQPLVEVVLDTRSRKYGGKAEYRMRVTEPNSPDAREVIARHEAHARATALRSQGAAGVPVQRGAGGGSRGKQHRGHVTSPGGTHITRSLSPRSRRDLPLQQSAQRAHEVQRQFDAVPRVLDFGGSLSIPSAGGARAHEPARGGAGAAPGAPADVDAPIDPHHGDRVQLKRTHDAPASLRAGHGPAATATATARKKRQGRRRGDAAAAATGRPLTAAEHEAALRRKLHALRNVEKMNTSSMTW